MTSVIFSNGGTLDKFIGDAIMAVWGNVRSLGIAQDAKNCAHAALGMRGELRKLNEKWRGEGRMGLGMAIGINQGEVIVGNIGSQERMDPTVIGDAVNLASRLESLTRVYGIDILVGASAAELVRDEVYLRSVARVQVKGKIKPMTFYFPWCADEQVDQEFLKWPNLRRRIGEISRTRFYRGEDPVPLSGILSGRSAGKMYLERTPI
jgi:adenylate cyclase